MASAVVAAGPVQIHLGLPKGHMQENVFKLFEDSGLKINLGVARGYRPTLTHLENYDVKLLKAGIVTCVVQIYCIFMYDPTFTGLQPQNILGMLHTGVRDIGFAGADWVEELVRFQDIISAILNRFIRLSFTSIPVRSYPHCIQGVDVVEVLDTGLDPVRIVAASPDSEILKKGGREGRKLIIASEYEVLCRKWMAAKGIDATFLRAYGATESLPPEDADIIVDNAATGGIALCLCLQRHFFRLPE